jgi:hypothetical protein
MRSPHSEMTVPLIGAVDGGTDNPIDRNSSGCAHEGLTMGGIAFNAPLVARIRHEESIINFFQCGKEGSFAKNAPLEGLNARAG